MTSFGPIASTLPADEVVVNLPVDPSPEVRIPAVGIDGNRAPVLWSDHAKDRATAMTRQHVDAVINATRVYGGNVARVIPLCAAAFVTRIAAQASDHCFQLVIGEHAESEPASRSSNLRVEQ